MTREGCYLCAGDPPPGPLCDYHDWLVMMRACALDGTLSDWDPMPTSGQPVPVSHTGTMTSGTIALIRNRVASRQPDVRMYRFMRLMAELGAVLNGVGAQFDDRSRDSLGDRGARDGIYPQWLKTRWVILLELREKGETA